MRSSLVTTLVLVLTFASTRLTAEDSQPGLPSGGNVEKIPTIKEIMRDAHRCRTNYIYLVRRGLQQQDTAWFDAEQKSRELVKMGHYLQQNTPPKGTRDDWEKITNIYISHATLLADAAERQDMETATHHLGKLQRMCATCHRAHR